MKITRKIFELAYLAFSLLFFVESYIRWTSQRNKAYVFLGMAFLALFMFFFRRRFRKKSEDYYKNSK
ncbi:MAG: LPXTG cell wall anchor domain-containing protein [Flavobacteriaceae bacterium]